MSVNTNSLSASEPPPGSAFALGERISQAALLVLCAGPIVLFPIALAIRIIHHYFP